MKKKIELNLFLHIPYVLKNYRVFDIGRDENFNYFDEEKTKEILNVFSSSSYLKVNKILYNLIKIHRKKFKISLTITGVSIEIMKKFNVELLDSFKKLVNTGQVELKSSFYHSLSVPDFSKKEVLEQIDEHKKIIKEVFRIDPTNFSNNFYYYDNCSLNLNELVKKFSNENKKLTKLKFNYDFFGIKNKEESGVFNFLKHLPNEFMKEKFEFVNFNNEISNKSSNFEFIKLNHNKIQNGIFNNISELEQKIKDSGNLELIENWKRISSFDYILNLNQKNFKENSKNNFFHYGNSYDLYINLKNIIEDMKLKLNSNFKENSNYHSLNSKNLVI